MDRKIKALWLPSWYPSKVLENNARFIQRHAESASLYCDVNVLYATANKGSLYEIEVVQRNPTMKEVRVYFPPTQSKLLKWFRMLRAVWKGFRFIKVNTGKPDLLHLSVIYPAGWAALMLSWVYRLPLVIDEHWTGYRKSDNSYKGFQMKTLAKLCTRRSSAIITETASMGHAMKQHGLTGKYFVTPNVVDDMPVAIAGNDQMAKDTFRFIHASGFDERHKNITGLLKAIERLSARRQDFEVVMAGGLHLAEPFKKLADKMGLHKIIHFPGFIDRQVLRQQMADSNAFILFSNFEGLPCVVLEAMSVGTPVICTEIGGMDEWITPETGILIEPGDEDALVDAMSRMIDTSHIYDRQLISKKVWERCSYEVVGKKFLDVYREVLKI